MAKWLNTNEAKKMWGDNFLVMLSGCTVRHEKGVIYIDVDSFAGDTGKSLQRQAKKKVKES